MILRMLSLIKTGKNKNVPAATSIHVTELGDAKLLTRGSPDGRWLDGSAGTNPRRWKK